MSVVSKLPSTEGLFVRLQGDFIPKNYFVDVRSDGMSYRVSDATGDSFTQSRKDIREFAKALLALTEEVD